MSLTIEFAGVSTLVWHKDKKEAAVVLVDLEAAGFHTHHATLAAEGGSGITCPDPDTALAVPGLPFELGVWNLKGSELEVIADAGSLEIDDSKVDDTKPPPEKAASIRWLPEIGALCQSRTLAPGVPVAARMPLKIGRVSATAAAHPPVRVVFDDNDERIGTERYVLPRFMVEIESPKVKLRLDRKREFTFEADHHVIISNACVCEPRALSAANHFYGHYLLVEAKRKPRVRQTSGPFRRPKTFAIPEDPPQCYCACLEI